MKKAIIFLSSLFIVTILTSSSCNDSRPVNTTALDEQAATEINQKNLFTSQPPPKISWSLERDNLIKRFKLQNDRSVMFYMYVFIEGVGTPIGYYQVNKVSSVNSQLTNTMQIISGTHSTNDLPTGAAIPIPSPAEDGSYGTNGDAVFGFTPEEIYIETNMKYITSTVPLNFKENIPKLAVISTNEAKKMLEVSKNAMNK